MPRPKGARNRLRCRPRGFRLARAVAFADVLNLRWGAAAKASVAMEAGLFVVRFRGEFRFAVATVGDGLAARSWSLRHREPRQVADPTDVEWLFRSAGRFWEAFHIAATDRSFQRMHNTLRALHGLSPAWPSQVRKLIRDVIAAPIVELQPFERELIDRRLSALLMLIRKRGDE